MNWMTVKDVARHLKLSEMMVYKLAQNGELPAAKIGSAWRFSQSEIDRWLIEKTGSSKDVAGPAGEALDDFIGEIKDVYKENFVTAVLFGSYARGNPDKGSDIDVLIVLKNVKDLAADASRVGEIAYSKTFGKGRSVVMAPLVMTEEEFLTGVSPLLLNIRKEGVKAA